MTAELGTWAVVLISVTSSLLAMLLVVVCCVCKTDKDCFLYKHCPLKLAPSHKKIRRTPSNYGTTGRELLSLWRDRSRSISQDWSSTSDDDVIELAIVGVKQWAATREGTLKVISPDAAGQDQSFYRGGIVEMSMQHEGALLVNVLSVCGLVIDVGHVDMYFMAKLYRQSAISRRFIPLPSPNHVRRTRTQRGGSYTRFNQTLQFQILDKFLKSRLVVKLCLYEVDEYSRHLLSGECQFDVNLPQLIPKPLGTTCHVINEPLLQPKMDYLGEVKVALSYLPLAEKVVVSVICSHCVQKPDKEKISSNIYFRVALMTGSKQLRKHRTQSTRNSNHVNFGETFSFDLPKDQLQVTYVMIAAIEEVSEYVVHEKPIHETKFTANVIPKDTSDVNSLAEETSQPPDSPITDTHDLPTSSLSADTSHLVDMTSEADSARKHKGKSISTGASQQSNLKHSQITTSVLNMMRNKNSAIGRVYLGSMFDGLAKIHWSEMTNNLRKHVACWHKLY